MKKALILLLCTLLVLPMAAMGNKNPVKAASTSFKDIPSNHKAYKEIMFLAQGKITTGDINGYFNPKNNVTRAEFSAFLGRALNFDGTKKKTAFKDVGSSNFASGYIQEATQKNIISGYKDGTFKPSGNVTRGEMALMICRALGYSSNNTTAGALNKLVSLGIAPSGSVGTGKALREDTAIYLARAINYKLRTKQNITFSGTQSVKADTLNVRSGPSTLYNSIGSLKYNETVSVGYKVGSWTLVKSKSQLVGFVSNAYLSSSDNSGNSGGTVTPPSNGGNSGTSLASQTLVIDPGHGGTDPGGIGYGLKEKDIVLDTGIRLRNYLSKTPLNVKMTRDTDVFVTLQGRVTFAKNVKANTFVSIHTNAGGGTGSETYYYGKASNPNVTDSKKLADCIQARLTAALGTKDRGEKHGDLHVLRENSMPAVLVELAFIDTKADNALLGSPTYRQKAAQGIYYGILDYYKSKGFNVSKYY
ncbi:N-acetylmuramoyl-L-alanine amidase [Bacillus sp. 1P06AnD]|uniref:N-acetylmuramoyl-L-alanine amidase n=1 Tax=Bacillus sp. 1P06AnD TaxID=3132208 RepID=UPI00399EFE28